MSHGGGNQKDCIMGVRAYDLCVCKSGGGSEKGGRERERETKASIGAAEILVELPSNQ